MIDDTLIGLPGYSEFNAAAAANSVKYSRKMVVLPRASFDVYDYAHLATVNHVQFEMAASAPDVVRFEQTLEFLLGQALPTNVFRELTLVLDSLATDDTVVAILRRLALLADRDHKGLRVRVLARALSPSPGFLALANELELCVIHWCDAVGGPQPQDAAALLAASRRAPMLLLPRAVLGQAGVLQACVAQGWRLLSCPFQGWQPGESPQEAIKFYRTLAANYRDDLLAGKRYLLLPFGDVFLRPATRIFHCSAGVNSVYVNARGELAPCPAFTAGCVALGTSEPKGLNRKKRLAFYQQPANTRVPCAACWALPFCGGGCVKAAVEADGQVHAVDEARCGVYREIVALALYLMRQMGQEQRSTIHSMHQLFAGHSLHSCF